MDKKTFLERTTAIGTCENSDERLRLLTELSEEVSKDYDTAEALTQQLNETNEKLVKAQETNMAYFLRLNDQKTPEEIQKNATGVEKEKEKEYKSYNELMDSISKKK